MSPNALSVSRARRSSSALGHSLWLALSLTAWSPAAETPTTPPGVQPEHPGAVIYRKLCVDCHGARGQGVADKYDEPLHGNRSVEALAKRIARTMPDDNVGACVGEDAKQVAAYIYDAFYSPKAQWRLHPPEFDFARLTIPQYRTSITDLVGRFRPGFDAAPGERGLNAHYEGLVPEKPEPAPEAATPPAAPEAKPATPAPTAQPATAPAATPTPTPKPKPKAEDKKDRPKFRFDRKDAVVDFNFGSASPDPEKMDSEQFQISWNGSVFAPETGTYEFVVRTENGVRLFVNEPKTPLIDAWVSSGPNVREEKKSIFLLGGRSYPIQLQFFKFKEKTASVRLEWKTPNGVLEPIPNENLSRVSPRPSMVVSVTFPADDRSAGYERGTSISKEWDQATTDGAIEVAEHVDSHLDELAGTKSGAPDRLNKLKAFARRFVETAFRRPLSDQDYQHLVERPFAQAKAPDLAIKRIVLFTLKSPRFLFPEIPQPGEPDGYQVAERLALNLWDSIPDQKLLEAAASGKLKTREQVAAQAQRMIGDPRTKAKLHGFFHYWLELERAESASKDPKAFPEFDQNVLADMRKSLMIFLDDVIWSDRSDYRELLQADYLMLNPRLAKLYGREVKGPGFEKVTFDPRQRAGVVTHPYLLTAFAYSKQTSPVHRGVFLTRTIVGMSLKPPPMAIAFEDAKFDAHLTMREKITEMTKNESCMGCHSTINPLGFSLENYDAIGRWRTKENNKPINAVADFNTDDGETIRLTGARDLVKYAAENAGGHRAFIHHMCHHIAKQEVGLYGPDALEELRQSFMKSGFSVRKLLGEIATMSAARGLPESEHKVAQGTQPQPAQKPL